MRAIAITAFLALCSAGCGNSGCDDKLYAVTCTYPPTFGQCVDFTGLSTADQTNTQNECLARGGNFDAGVCTASGRLGTCSIPWATPNDDLGCSPKATVLIRYYPSGTFTGADAAVSACAEIPDAGFTAN